MIECRGAMNCDLLKNNERKEPGVMNVAPTEHRQRGRRLKVKYCAG